MTRVSNVYDISVNTTLEQMRKMDPFDFQDMIVEDIFDGVSSGFDKDGIDGYARNGSPIQVKRSDKVGRNVLVTFASSMRDVGKKRGYIVAFSFTGNTRNRVSIIKKRQGINIILKTVEELLRQNKSHVSLEVVKKKLTKNQRDKINRYGYVNISVNNIFRIITDRHLSSRGYVSVYYIKQKKL